MCCIGTGGTITGTGRYLKEQNPLVRVVGIEPSGSAVLSGKKAGAHKQQGIGAGFVPKVLDTSVYDEIITVTDDEAYEMTKELYKTEGIMAGISSGTALCGAIKVAMKNQGKNVVLILPDTGKRYISLGIFD